MPTSHHLTANVKILIVLFLLGTWALSAPPATAQDETLTGWFSFMVADYPSEAGLVSETTYFLTEDSGERHELLIDIDLMRPLGGPVALNRKRVTVMGEWEEVGPAVPEKFRVSSIELATSPSPPFQWEPFAADSFPAQPAPLRPAPLPAAEPDSHVRGSQAWVTILCRFGDATDVTPHPVSHYEDLMGSAEPQLGHYWNEVSYGHLPNLSGSIVVGWYNLPRPRSYYVYDKDGDGDEDHKDLNGQRLTEDCMAAGDADVFFPDFWGINLVFNGELGVGGFASSERLTKDGQTRFWGVSALSSSGSEHAAIWAHEMGHTFGLLHSSGPYGQDDPPSSPTTYDSAWDVMSGGGVCRLRDPEYGCIGVHTIAYHKDFLGWIPPARKYVAPRNSTRTITLERLAKPGSDGYLLAQIPIGDSGTDFYTVETRLFAGYDDEIPDEAIVIHKVDTTRADRLAQVVDVDNNGDPNDAGAMWTVGETFTDLANGLQVSVDAEHATGFDVTLAYTACAEALSPTRALVRGVGIARVAVVAPSGCRWVAQSDRPWLTILAGSGSGTGSVVYAVAANPNLNARTGALTIGGRVVTVTQAGVNDNLFEDDMESERGPHSMNAHIPCDEEGCNCHEDGRCAIWELTTASSHSGTHAWTDSLGGNYQNNRHVASSSPEINLSRITSATLTFWHRYDFGSGDAGQLILYHPDHENPEIWRPEPLRTFTGTNLSWEQVSVDLSPFVGQQIEVAFHLQSDASGTADGWYIDDVAVFSSDFEPLTPDPDLCQDYGPCSAGQGDCDPGQCGRGLVCVNDAGAQYGLPAHYDVCEAGPDPDYCQDGPCSVGEGDCDPGQCGRGLVCVNDVGAQYGLPAHYDVCEADPTKILFADNMESGTEGYYVDSCLLSESGDCASNLSTWALTTASSHSGTQAWTDSPNGNYQNNVHAVLYTPWIDLTEVSSATLVFWERFDFADGDQSNIWVTPETEKWVNIRSFVGRNATPWRQVSLDLTPFVGQKITVNFGLQSDASGTADGWYIDDVVVFSTESETVSAPDPDYCQDYGPCSAGQGDCDPGQCGAGLVCVNDVGAQYGLPPHYDVCEVPSS